VPRARLPTPFSLANRQFVSVSLVTAVPVPSKRTLAAPVRPIVQMVSSAGLPMTVTAGVAFFTVIR